MNTEKGDQHSTEALTRARGITIMAKRMNPPFYQIFYFLVNIMTADRTASVHYRIRIIALIPNLRVGDRFIAEDAVP